MDGQKVALITGAGSGMGQLACKNFAQAGWRVAALDINEKGLAATAEGSKNIATWTVDVTDFKAVEAVVAEIESTLGPIHTVYNCAAVLPMGKLLEQDNSIIHKQMQINYGGLVNISQTALKRMVQRGDGVFVSFASMASFVPTLLVGAYSATKAAVATFNEVLYHENRHSGVKFASVCPPMVNTPLLDRGRNAVWPKMLDVGVSPIGPQVVLDKIQACLDKGRFLVFPTRFAAIFYYLRRLCPAAIWAYVHRVEGF